MSGHGILAAWQVTGNGNRWVRTCAASVVASEVGKDYGIVFEMGRGRWVYLPSPDPAGVPATATFTTVEAAMVECDRTLVRCGWRIMRPMNPGDHANPRQATQEEVDALLRLAERLP